jgi:hypothetical protein
VPLLVENVISPFAGSHPGGRGARGGLARAFAVDRTPAFFAPSRTRNESNTTMTVLGPFRASGSSPFPTLYSPPTHHTRTDRTFVACVIGSSPQSSAVRVRGGQGAHLFPRGSTYGQPYHRTPGSSRCYIRRSAIMNRSKARNRSKGEDMLQWIIVGFLYIASFGLLAVLGGLAAAGEAFQRWASAAAPTPAAEHSAPLLASPPVTAALACGPSPTVS